jgi:hypothetical protein
MATIPNEEKVFMVSNSTNTTYSGSASLKAMQEWYTMQDVTDTVRPYQVFTALLTQSGEDDPQILLSQDTPSLTIGVTYQITDDGGSGWDFTNVGAPNNDLDTYFIATGTTPANWGTNGMLTYNTGAPVATVLENTIGNIWFTYVDVGNYYINSNALFIENKTFVYFKQFNQGAQWDYNDAFPNQIELVGADNNQLFNTPIEIRVYN